jgi:hypothetical protein
MAATCTNPDCDRPVPDAYLCQPCTNTLHALLEGLLYSRRRRGIGPVLQPDDRDAVREGIDGSSYRLDTLKEPPGSGPGLLEDLAVTISRIDVITYRPSLDAKPCAEPGCVNLADVGSWCTDCADYLPAERKRVALVPPAVKARDALVNHVTTTARLLEDAYGLPAVQDEATAARQARAEVTSPWSPATADARLDRALERERRLTAPLMPLTVGWLAGLVSSVRAHEWAGECLSQLQQHVDHATRVIDRPEGTVRIPCPRCGGKVPIPPDPYVMASCRRCTTDGTDAGKLMIGVPGWWAEQVAPPGEPVEVDYLPIVMPRYGHHGLKLHTMRTWVDRGLVPVQRTVVKPGGRSVRQVDPALVAVVAARMAQRKRNVRA